jgi:hypothetical protein
MPSEHPKVFISYSHDSPEHAQHVLELAERLRKDGVDAQIDQHVAGTPPEGWPRWMLDRLDWAEFVLMVCTETYYRRFRGHEELGKGKGADWEGNLITLEMYNEKSTTTKFAPVFFASQDEQFIPEPLRGHTQYLLNSEENYTKLYAFLTGQAGVTPSELGSLKTLARNPVEPLRFETVVDHALKEARAERLKRILISPGKRTWLSVAGVVIVLALVVVAAILYFGSHRPEAKPTTPGVAVQPTEILSNVVYGELGASR